MIDASAIERAEKTLQVVYGQSVERQLEHLQVEREAFDALLQHRKGILQRRYSEAYASLDPRLETGLNTIMMDIFLTGLVAGRNSIREIM